MRFENTSEARDWMMQNPLRILVCGDGSYKFRYNPTTKKFETYLFDEWCESIPYSSVRDWRPFSEVYEHLDYRLLETCFNCPHCKNPINFVVSKKDLEEEK